MTRTMYDSTRAADIPADAEVVGGYVEGIYKWSAEDWARFPRARKVRIAVWEADGDMLDVERGDATPEMAPDWIRRQRARGLAYPTLYFSLSLWPTIRAVCAGLTYDVCIADYGTPGTPSYGRPHMIPGAAATQYADPAAGSGGHYDLSLCQDYWPRGGDDLPDKATIQAWIREVLDEGTALGQGSWRDTNKALLATIQAVYNMDNGELGNENAQARILQQILDGIKALAAQGVPPANLQPLLDAIKGLTLKAA